MGSARRTASAAAEVATPRPACATKLSLSAAVGPLGGAVLRRRIAEHAHVLGRRRHAIGARGRGGAHVGLVVALLGLVDGDKALRPAIAALGSAEHAVLVARARAQRIGAYVDHFALAGATER